MLWDKPQGGGCGDVCRHPLDGCAAVATVLGVIGRIDARAKRALVFTDIINDDVNLQTRDADPGSSRVQCVTEPTFATAVPGPHVRLIIHADNPYRYPPAQRPVGTPGGNLQFVRVTDLLQLARRPGGRPDVNTSSSGVDRQTAFA